jgi:hypothetical protein
MKKPKTNAQPANKQKETRKRTTLDKMIAAAPTRAEKWEIALNGGKPLTEIQNLPFFVFGLQNPSPHGEEWRLQTIEGWKKKFADLLFPALMKDDPRPFEEILEAMARRRKTSLSLEEFVRRQKEQRKIKPSKKEIGRRLRLALLDLWPDELLNIQTVKAALNKKQATYQQTCDHDINLYYDDSKIYAVMKELNLRFMQPGEAARWIYGKNVVRKLTIQPDGTPKVEGMTLEEIQALPTFTCQSRHVVKQNPVGN